MLGRLRWLRRLALELPRNLKLAYCLAYDPRVPVVNKAALGVALALVVTPVVNLPAWVPVVGEMDVIALSLLATQLFIAAADAGIVAEQEALVRRRESRFDHDVAAGRRLAVLIARHVPGRGHLPEQELVGHAQSHPAVNPQEHGVQS